VLPLLHVLALSVVAAQLLAGFANPPGPRAPTPWRTVKLAGAALIPVVPFIAWASTRATGVHKPLALTFTHWWSVLAASLAGDSRNFALTTQIATSVLLLAGIGAYQLREKRHRAFLTYLWCWAAIPPILLGLAAFTEPTLVPRYFIVSLPAWALLAGQGIAVIATTLARPLFKRELNTRALALAALTGMAPLLALTGLGLPRQQQIRTTIGHGDGDCRPAVTLLNTPAYRDLPVAVLPNAWMVLQAAAYDPHLPTRTLLADGPRISPTGRIVLADLPTDTTGPRLTTVNTLAALIYTSDPTAARQFTEINPALNQFMVSRVTTFDTWSVVLLTRRTT
jgi:hypothetical protein